MNIHHYQEQTTEKYYVAAFNTWGQNLRNGLITKVREWCKITYGEIDRNDSNPRWKDDIIWGEVRFRDEADLMIFLLRWE